MREIDHDPAETPHKAIKMIAWISAAITLAIMFVLSFWLRWVVDNLPLYLVSLFGGLMMGVAIGIKLGWWDAERYYSRMKGKDG